MSTSAKHNSRSRTTDHRRPEHDRSGPRGRPAGRRRAAEDEERLERLVREISARLSSPFEYEAVVDRIVPMLPRVYPAQTYGLQPAIVFLPPGIPVEFAVDMGGSYGSLMIATLDEWGVDPGTVALAALANVRRDADGRDHRAVEEMTRDGIRVRALRPSNGWESAMILVPDVLERFFGSEPLIVAAPLRPTLMAFDGGTDPALAFDLSAQFAATDPRGLAVDPMRLEEGRLHPYRRLPDGALEEVMPAWSGPGGAPLARRPS
jgi:hypothetical protein